MVLGSLDFLLQVNTILQISFDLAWSHDEGATNDYSEDVEDKRFLELQSLDVSDERARLDFLLTMFKWHIQLTLYNFLLLVFRFKPRLDSGCLTIILKTESSRTILLNFEVFKGAIDYA